MEIQLDPPTAPLDLGPPLGATADDGDVAPDLGDPGERRRVGARAWLDDHAADRFVRPGTTATSAASRSGVSCFHDSGVPSTNLVAGCSRNVAGE